MYTRRNIRWSVVLGFAWAPVVVFAAWSGEVTYAYIRLKADGIDCSMPIAPLTTIGVAVAFYIGFKNNQSYDRNWEARKIWGGIVHFARQVRTNQEYALPTPVSLLQQRVYLDLCRVAAFCDRR